jgi:LGFP repeat
MVTRSQGAQVGDGNVQVNLFPGDRRPDFTGLDALLLGALSPHTAVWRIRAMRYDDAVLVLARAEVVDTAKVLAVLLKVDEPLAVSLLADINRSKAEALIAALPADLSASGWLLQLPEAAEAIGSCVVEMKWAGTGDAGRLERAAESAEGTKGYRQSYRGGWVYWSQEHGAQAITGEIAQYYEAAGGTGKLGFPVNREDRLRSSFGTNGSGQQFETLEIFASVFGIFAMSGNIIDAWNNNGNAFGDYDSGEPEGELGFPISEEAQLADAVGDRSIQRFEGGVIYSAESGAFAVRSPVADYLDTNARNNPQDLYYPVADEADAEVSPYETAGRMQKFDGNSVCELVIYSSDECGIHGVFGPMLDYYTRLNGTSSWLGFPKTECTALPSALDAYGQEFEGGTVFWEGRADEEPLGVPAASMELISRDDEIKQRLGLPVSEDQPIGADGSGRIQFFDNGTVTLRDGEREIWLRPSFRET